VGVWRNAIRIAGAQADVLWMTLARAI